MPKKKKSKKNKYKKKSNKITDKKYLSLLKKSRKSLNTNEKKILNKALHQRYCSCLKKLENNKKLDKNAPFGICGTSIYLNRGFDIPKNASRTCKKSKK